MAKQQTAAVEAKTGVSVRVREFYQEVMTEMSKVTWPTKDELKSSTQVVMILLAIFAAVIYAYDVVFQVVVVGLFRLI